MDSTQNSSPLDQVNSMFGNPAGVSAPAPVVAPQPAAQPQMQTTSTEPSILANQDSMFNEPIGPSQNSIDQANAYASQGINLGGASSNAPAAAISNAPNPQDAAAAGAVAGAILGGKSAITPAPKNNSLLNAKATASAQDVAAKRLENVAQTKQIEHAQRLEDTKKTLDNLRVQHAQANAEHMLAREEAIKLDAMPEEHEFTGSKKKVATGDKWAFGNPEKGTTGIIGEGHAGGTSVAEAAENYRLQESLTPSERAKFKANRKGILIPNELPVQTPLTPAQAAAKQHVLDTHVKVFGEKGTANQLAEQEGKLKTLETKGAISPQLESKVADKSVKALESAEKARYLEDALKESGFAKFGRLAGKVVGPVLGGAGAGFEGAEAMRDYEKGDYVPMALHGMSALGSGLSMVPHPLAKGVGLAMAAPGMAYDIYKELHPGALPSGKK